MLTDYPQEHVAIKLRIGPAMIPPPVYQMRGGDLGLRMLCWEGIGFQNILACCTKTLSITVFALVRVPGRRTAHCSPADHVEACSLCCDRIILELGVN